jgi:hypothetical protein
MLQERLISLCPCFRCGEKKRILLLFAIPYLSFAPCFSWGEREKKLFEVPLRVASLPRRLGKKTR